MKTYIGVLSPKMNQDFLLQKLTANARTLKTDKCVSSENVCNNSGANSTNELLQIEFTHFFLNFFSNHFAKIVKRPFYSKLLPKI